MKQFKSVAIAIKQYERHRGLTLIELLIAVSIFSLIVVGFSNIDTFSHYHVLSSDKRVKLQNEVSYVLGHIGKNASSAIGNERIYGFESVIEIDIVPPTVLLQIYTDTNKNGRREESPPDYWVAYLFEKRGPPVNRYEISYCGQCGTKPCNFSQCQTEVEVLARKIENFSPSVDRNPDTTLQNNYLNVQISACWDPDGSPVACGSLDNPALSMKNRISMPAVSTH